MSFFKEQRIKSSFKRTYFQHIYVNAEIPQGSILGLSFFLIYINELADELSCNAKLFADDTSLSSVMHNIDSAIAELNNDFAKMRN